jgi:hypothetical protein
VRPELKRALLLLVLALVVFSCGVAVGQQAGRSKFSRYLVHSQATELDRQFVSMQIEEIQNTLNVLEQGETPERTDVPSYHLNPNTGKIQVLVTVHGNWADKAPLDEVQRSLKSQALEIVGNLKFHMPEVSDADVYVSFAKINVFTNEIINNFAEYRDGVLTIRH